MKQDQGKILPVVEACSSFSVVDIWAIEKS